MRNAVIRPLRTPGRLLRTFAACSLAAAFLSAGPALARQNDEPKPAAPATPQTLLLLDYAGPSTLFVSPKDTALSRALSMIPARVDELFAQIPELANVPRPAVELLLGVCSHPVRIAVTNKGFDQQTGVPGFGGVVSFALGAGGEESARAMHRQVEFVRSQAAAAFQPSPSKRFEGLTDLPLPMGVLSYGPRRAPDGWRYELIFAAIDDPDAPFKGLAPAPQGLTPAVRGRLDVAAWGPIIQMFAGFISMASPEGKQAMKDLRESGLIGPEAPSIEYVKGYTADAFVGIATVRKLGPFAEKLGVTRATITPADLAAIPADATAAMIQKADLKQTWAKLKAQVDSAGGAGKFDDALRQIEAETGVDIEQEIIASLGASSIVYVSDSTGGGSVLSAVALLGLSDPQKLSGALGRLCERANAQLRQEVPPPGRVELARFESDGVSYTQLRFPGLPIPLELTCAVAGQWLVAGLTPQAASVAAIQAKSGTAKNGLEANAAFSSGRWAGHEATSLTFVDSGRTLRGGYPIMTQLGSLISNATRTDQQGGRDAGMIVPNFAQLREGARAAISVTYWQGDDWVMESRGDRSVLVNAAGVLGVADLGEFVVGAIVGAGVGAKAAEAAAERRGGDREGFEPTDDEHDRSGHDDEHERPAEGQDEATKEKPRRNVPY